MARLILDENGERRAFKLRDGKLTLGSGQGCTLTLSSPDVAEVHAELELAGDRATLVPRPGVTPPKIAGKPVTQATTLTLGGSFTLGSATITLQADDAPVAAAAAAPKPVARPAAKPAAPAPARRGPAAAPAPTGESRSRVQSQRRTVQRGMPTWAVLCIVGAVALIGFFVVRQWMAETGEISYDPQERYNQAVIAFNEGEVNRAMTELGRIDLDVATPELKTKVEELRARVEAGDKSQEIEARYVQATKILDTQLKRYEEKYLRGNDVSRAKARLFVKRCDDFRHEFPGHPDMEWVTRFRDRWSELADLSEPATVEDVAWEVKMLTGGKPRDYTEVFRLLNDVVKRADGADRDAALAMLDTQEAERTEYFEDRMQQARWHWEREEYGQAFEWLVQVATKIGDDEMRDRAADALVKMVDKQGRPLTDRFMEGYKRDRPWQFEDMLKVPALKEAAQRSGLL